MPSARGEIHLPSLTSFAKVRAQRLKNHPQKRDVMTSA